MPAGPRIRPRVPVYQTRQIDRTVAILRRDRKGAPAATGVLGLHRDTPAWVASAYRMRPLRHHCACARGRRHRAWVAPPNRAGFGTVPREGMVETSMKTYRVSYERDESGWWVASVQGVRGCRTQGRTVDEARRRIIEAMELFVDDARRARIVDDVKLP